MAIRKYPRKRTTVQRELQRLPPKPRWRRHEDDGELVPPTRQDHDAPLMPLPLIGPSPNFRNRTSTYVGMPQHVFKPERLLVSKVGNGRFTAQLFIGNELHMGAESTDFDPELIGHPQSFGALLNIRAIEPGTQLRLVVTWHPPPYSCVMSIEEFERRSNENDWTSTVYVDGEQYRLTIDHRKVGLQMVDVATYRKLQRQRLTRDFTPYVQFNAMFLGRCIL